VLGAAPKSEGGGRRSAPTSTSGESLRGVANLHALVSPKKYGAKSVISLGISGGRCRDSIHRGRPAVNQARREGGGAGAPEQVTHGRSEQPSLPARLGLLRYASMALGELTSTFPFPEGDTSTTYERDDAAGANGPRGSMGAWADRRLSRHEAGTCRALHVIRPAPRRSFH